MKDDKSDAYYLNGHWMISLSKSFRLAGSEAHYKRNGDTRYGGETIKVDGPLKNSVDVMVKLITTQILKIITYTFAASDWLSCVLNSR